jgi:hypothetical protein
LPDVVMDETLEQLKKPIAQITQEEIVPGH